SPKARRCTLADEIPARRAPAILGTPGQASSPSPSSRAARSRARHLATGPRLVPSRVATAISARRPRSEAARMLLLTPRVRAADKDPAVLSPPGGGCAAGSANSTVTRQPLIAVSGVEYPRAAQRCLHLIFIRATSAILSLRLPSKGVRLC